jgi:hypothetical protein
MTEELKFEGFDKDYKKSLFNHGFICRNEKSDQYICFYKTKDNQYDYGFMNNSEIQELMSLKSWMTKEQKEDFLKFCGQTQQNFDKLPFLHKTYSLVQFFGYEDILGKSYSPMSLIEAIHLIENE